MNRSIVYSPAAAIPLWLLNPSGQFYNFIAATWGAYTSECDVIPVEFALTAAGSLYVHTFIPPAGVWDIVVVDTDLDEVVGTGDTEETTTSQLAIIGNDLNPLDSVKLADVAVARLFNFYRAWAGGTDKGWLIGMAQTGQINACNEVYGSLQAIAITGDVSKICNGNPVNTFSYDLTTGYLYKWLMEEGYGGVISATEVISVDIGMFVGPESTLPGLIHDVTAGRLYLISTESAGLITNGTRVYMYDETMTLLDQSDLFDFQVKVDGFSYPCGLINEEGTKLYICADYVSGVSSAIVYSIDTTTLTSEVMLNASAYNADLAGNCTSLIIYDGDLLVTIDGKPMTLFRVNQITKVYTVKTIARPYCEANHVPPVVIDNQIYLAVTDRIAHYIMVIAADADGTLRVLEVNKLPYAVATDGVQSLLGYVTKTSSYYVYLITMCQGVLGKTMTRYPVMKENVIAGTRDVLGAIDAIEAGGGGATPAEIWTHGDRTLTSPAVMLPAFQGRAYAGTIKHPEEVEIQQGDTASIPFDFGRDCAGWAVSFAAKIRKEDAAFVIAETPCVWLNAAKGQGYIPSPASDIANGVYAMEVIIRKGAEKETQWAFRLKVPRGVVTA